jgi:hypothetical protein
VEISFVCSVECWEEFETEFKGHLLTLPVMAINQADPGQTRFGHCDFFTPALRNVDLHYATTEAGYWIDSLFVHLSAIRNSLIYFPLKCTIFTLESKSLK